LKMYAQSGVHVSDVVMLSWESTASTIFEAFGQNSGHLTLAYMQMYKIIA
jgi:hypothetical protein